MRYRFEPNLVQFRLVGDAVRLDVFRHGFIDISLGELGISPARAMPDQFMRAGAADAGKDEIPDPVFQDRAVADFENMTDVGLIAARPGLGEAHVADTAG